MWKGTNVLVIASKQKKRYLKQSETCVISAHREEIMLEKLLLAHRRVSLDAMRVHNCFTISITY